MNDEIDLETRELRSGFGVEIMHLDVAKANTETRQAVVDAFDLHGAVLLRGQEVIRRRSLLCPVTRISISFPIERKTVVRSAHTTTALGGIRTIPTRTSR